MKDKNDTYCNCPHPIRVVSSPIDTVDTCKYCGKIINDSAHTNSDREV